MADGVDASHVEELPTIWDGFGKLVRKGLGIMAFGANIMDLPPDYTTRAHAETSTGQEELYVGLRGAGVGRPRRRHRDPPEPRAARARVTGGVAAAAQRAGGRARAVHRRRARAGVRAAGLDRGRGLGPAGAGLRGPWCRVHLPGPFAPGPERRLGGAVDARPPRSWNVPTPGVRLHRQSDGQLVPPGSAGAPRRFDRLPTEQPVPPPAPGRLPTQPLFWTQEGATRRAPRRVHIGAAPTGRA